jgi:hypothetical protein
MPMLRVMVSVFATNLVTYVARAFDKRPRVGLHGDLSPVIINGREVLFCLKMAMVQRITEPWFCVH